MSITFAKQVRYLPTIGLIEGPVKIGLEPHELERLADVSKNASVVKLTRRDVGAAIVLKRDRVSDHTSCILNVCSWMWGHDLQYHSHVRCISWHQGRLGASRNESFG